MQITGKELKEFFDSQPSRYCDAPLSVFDYDKSLPEGLKKMTYGHLEQCTVNDEEVYEFPDSLEICREHDGGDIWGFNDAFKEFKGRKELREAIQEKLEGDLLDKFNRLSKRWLHVVS